MFSRFSSSLAFSWPQGVRSSGTLKPQDTTKKNRRVQPGSVKQNSAPIKQRGAPSMLFSVMQRSSKLGTIDELREYAQLLNTAIIKRNLRPEWAKELHQMFQTLKQIPMVLEDPKQMQSLEYLGDRVLQFLVTRYLVEKMKGQSDELLHEYRSSLVCNDRLGLNLKTRAKVSTPILESILQKGLGACPITLKKIAKFFPREQLHKKMGDAYEVLVASLYLTIGMESTWKAIIPDFEDTNELILAQTQKRIIMSKKKTVSEPTRKNKSPQKNPKGESSEKDNKVQNQ